MKTFNNYFNSSISKNFMAISKVLLVSIIIFCLVIGIQFELSGVSNPEANIVVYKSELVSRESNFPVSMEARQVDSENYTLIYKLFNLFTVKKVNAKVIAENSVYLGGMSLGITIGADGAVIANIMPVITDVGARVPAEEGGLIVGDKILSINGKVITSLYDIAEVVRASNGIAVRVVFVRQNKTMTTEITPALDSLTKNYMLGIFVGESVSGIGTVTYIKTESKRYGALGHPTSNIKQDEKVYGKAYTTKIFGAIKGKKGKAGEILGQINQNEKIGNVELNTRFGIFGDFDNLNTSDMKIIEVGGKNTAKPGKAQIYTTVNEKGAKAYDIEIVKTEYQPEEKEKGLVIKITDKALIDVTGGIVQGMSGSPIVQDGKLVGAVSHVFINDPLRGYGMYIDWMIDR